MDREHEIQCLTQAEQQIAKIDEHITWQREVVDIVERINTSPDAAEGARALLTTFLEALAQHQKMRDRIRACLYGNTVSPSTTLPLLLLEAQVQREQDHGHGRILTTLDAKSDPCSTVPLTLFEAHAQREQDGDQIHLRPDCNLDSPATVPLGQSVDDRSDVEIHAQREQEGVEIHLSRDCSVNSPTTVPLKQPVDDRNGIAIQAQREQDGDEIYLSPHCNLDSPSIIPLEQPIDHQNKVPGLGDVAGTCADQTSLQLGAKPGHVWLIVQAAAVWISDLVSRHIWRARS